MKCVVELRMCVGVYFSDSEQLCASIQFRAHPSALRCGNILQVSFAADTALLLLLNSTFIVYILYLSRTLLRAF
jgi:hypothetical protein